MSIVNAFQKGPKPNEIWSDQGGEFYNNLFKRFLKINSIEMYSMYNEGKSGVAERFIRKTKFLSSSQLFQKMFIFTCLTMLLINTITQFTEQ